MQSSVTVTPPRSMSGFPEWLPEEKIIENKMIDIIRKHFERAGFTPIETPAVERCDVLTSKGGDEKEIYALGRFQDKGKNDDAKDFALHFDLTVPLARYVAQHQHELVFPFRRYQIQKVWRGERPQAGRFREFYQCDIDVIGDGTLSLLADAEMPAVAFGIFSEMNVGPFLIRMNNRKLLQGFLLWSGVSTHDIPEVLHGIDDLEKKGADELLRTLQGMGISAELAQRILSFTQKKFGIDTATKELESIGCDDPLYLQGAQELMTVLEAVRALGVPETHFCVDLSIVRGLDYYTGTVYEAQLLNCPEAGSVCSGGRYENLTGHFTEKKFPGVGISIGLSRLLSVLFHAGILSAKPVSLAPVLVTNMEMDHMQDYMNMGAELRQAGIGAEIYFDSKKFKTQMAYASKKGFRIALIAGSREFDDHVVVIKNLDMGIQKTVDRVNIVQEVKEMLDGMSKIF